MGFKCQRWTLANLLPVFFVLWVIGTIWILYVTLHLLYLLQLWRPEQPGQQHDTDEDMKRRGMMQCLISQTLTLMLAICFAKAIFTDPGGVPENQVWVPDLNPRASAEAEAEDSTAPENRYELKHSGLPRYCKWCNCYKPDRCHHCRVCRSCILRMDHHCPWIANCVGFMNHKHFLLLVFYSVSSCVYISATMSESLHRVLVEETTFVRRFLVVFGMTLSVMMGVLLMLFFVLHVWLMLKATTTIEFCEKAYKKNGTQSGQASIYDMGWFANIQSVLGPNPLLWLFPCVQAAPDVNCGLKFKVNYVTEDVPASSSGDAQSDAGGPAAMPNPDKARTTGGTSVPPEVTGQQGSNS